MCAKGLGLPCERVLAVELEMRDRDDMHRLRVTKAEIEMAREAAHQNRFDIARLI